MYSLPVFWTYIYTGPGGCHLGSITASVTGYTIVEGFVSTLLPPAWTSDRPLMPFETAFLTGMILIPLPPWPCLGLPATISPDDIFSPKACVHVPECFLLFILDRYPLGFSFQGAQLATPLSFNLVSATFIFYGYYYAASQLGPVTLAAQSVLLLSSSTTYQAPFALSVATSVRMGNLVGQGNARRAEVAAVTSIVMTVALGCIFSIIFLVFRHKWCYLFNSDPEVVSLVASILPLVALFQVFDATSDVTGGIFRARGKQSANAVLNLCAYYVLGIPLALYLAFARGHALACLWEGLIVGLVYSSAVGIWIGVRGVDWEAEVAIAQGRVGGKDE
ncbi:mate-domain-containing protein [Imleria badia]|nr:mate-domain-containing protein [Imleria badia]